MVPSCNQLVWFLIPLLAASVSSVCIDTTTYELQDYLSILQNNWDLIKSFDARFPDYEITKTIDKRTVITFATPDSFKYNFVPAILNSIFFKVKAKHDVSIAFATDPYELDSIVELFIGACNNSKTIIRVNRSVSDEVVLETPGIWDENGYRGFHVELGSGRITARRDGEPRPFITHFQADLTPNRYFGFRTSEGSRGDWIFEELLKQDTKEDRIVHFQVRTTNDAHIALTTSASNPTSGPAIEIALGGWGNTKSVLRRGISSPTDKVMADTPQIVNSHEYRGFWLRWGSVISVGHAGESYPFMTWRDPEPFEPTYIGIHTGFGAVGDWIFEGAPSVYTPDSKTYIYQPILHNSTKPFTAEKL